MHISVLNSTPLNLSLLPQPCFLYHLRQFTSPTSTPSLQELLQKISLSPRGVVRTQRTPLDPPLMPHAQISTSYVKAFECYRLTDRQTRPKLYTTPLRGWSTLDGGWKWWFMSVTCSRQFLWVFVSRDCISTLIVFASLQFGRQFVRDIELITFSHSWNFLQINFLCFMNLISPYRQRSK